MRILCFAMGHLFRNLGDDAGAHRQAAFPDGEFRPLLQRHRRDQLHRQLHRVPRHHHLHPFRQRNRPRYVHRPDVELRPIPREKRLVPSPRSTPLSSSPRLSPACPSSSSLWNISTPVTTEAMLFSLSPTISTPSPTLIFPRSTRPVTTVPRPLIENTSSIGIMNGLSNSRIGIGMYSSTTRSSSLIEAYSGAFGSVDELSSAFSAPPPTIGVSSHGNS